MTSKRETEMLEALKAMRQDTIEECASVAEINPYACAENIATAIRNLKNKRAFYYVREKKK